MANTWDFTFLLVHLTAAFAFAKLFKFACLMQKFVVVGMILSMMTMAGGFALKLNNVDGYIYVLWLGFVNMDLAVLAYAFRLVYKEYLCPPNGLRLYQK